MDRIQLQITQASTLNNLMSSIYSTPTDPFPPFTLHEVSSILKKAPHLSRLLLPSSLPSLKSRISNLSTHCPSPTSARTAVLLAPKLLTFTPSGLSLAVTSFNSALASTLYAPVAPWDAPPPVPPFFS
ncbi:hypothetical protein TrRE_jg10394, partial [Triparma retinervis]